MSVVILGVLFAALLASAYAETILLQNGRNGYGASVDTEISTQYIDAWNYNNGGSYFYGSLPYYSVSERTNSANHLNTTYRTLLKFEQLSNFVPVDSTVVSTDLTLSFINYNEAAVLQVCFITKPWDHFEIVKYKSTGWRYNRYAASGTGNSWTKPGGWSDCDSRVNITIDIPSNGGSGNITRTIPLDSGLVQEWLKYGNASNFGVLLRVVKGYVSVFSGSSALIAQRPALRITYSNAVPTVPSSGYPKSYFSQPTTWWVSNTGNDITGMGNKLYPFASPRKALVEAWPGDVIYLTNGTYAGGLKVERPRITLQSAPGHWAVIASPRNDPIASANVIQLRSAAKYGSIRNIEITGGHYYGIMFWSDWQNYPTIAENVNLADASGHYTIENVRVHHTGSSCIKMVMKVNNVLIKNSEITDCGSRMGVYGHGIEGVQSHHITIQDSYIADCPGAGIHLVGGSNHGLIQRNFIQNTGFGMNIGFATEYEYMDPINNPSLFENLNTVIVNNIITLTLQAGINLWAAANAVVAFNTLFNVQQLAQNAIILNSYQHTDAPNAPTIGCSNITIMGNIMRKSLTARVGPILQIRTDGLLYKSTLKMGYNVYSSGKGHIAENPWRWGQGIMLEDERYESIFVGNITGWANHCTKTLKQKFCDIGSIETNPLLNSDFAPLACSSAINLVDKSKLPTNILSLVSTDFHGNARDSNGDFWTSGAISTGHSVVKSLPPSVLTGAAPSYLGAGLPIAYYDTHNWPFYYWKTRKCTDVIVDNILGDDSQTFSYDSNYAKPFKTIHQAILSINQCDRILLRGGQVHAGPIGIYRPNVTVITHPDDSARATVKCANLGSDSNCVMMGDGFYDGAAEATLQNFDIVMTGNAGRCIQMNEGYGGGSSPYWSFYVNNSGKKKYSRGHTLIKDMTLTGCRYSAIKLSTFITGVVMENIHIQNIDGTGIEMRNGNNATIRNCVIEQVTGSGVVMGGGARNNLVEGNIIRNFGDRGVIVGSDNTEVQYMDTDYITSSDGSWHDAVNCVVQNNVIAHGVGAGISFYSARDSVAVHNTLFDVGTGAQAAILFNLSPKKLNATKQIYPSNENILVANNVVNLSPEVSNLPMVEARIMQSTLANIVLPSAIPTNQTGNCSSNLSINYSQPKTTNRRRNLRADSSPFQFTAETSSRKLDATYPQQPRNSDGSCPLFPTDSPWRLDVTGFPVHSNNKAIKTMINNGGNLHADFGGGMTVNGKYIPYGIPFAVVNTQSTHSSAAAPLQSLVPIGIASTGYPDECDGPLNYPFPDTVAIEGSYLNCPDATCGGDRHVLVVDNSTCTLYESWRSFPPNVTNNGWQVDIAVKFDMRSNTPRVLGRTSSDAAGLAVLSGLVLFDEVINKGFIDHAIRFTGRNSRSAYAYPASHFAHSGDDGADSPWMGMRVRLNATYDCTSLARAARIFCNALKTYGGIFADNGSPWYFSGEATTKWIPYLSELSDISKIPASAMEVIDPGECLCLDAECTIKDCGNGISDPNALPVYASVTDTSSVVLDHNYYHLSSGTGRFVDRKSGFLGKGYDGDLAGWKKHSNSFVKLDNHSVEVDPLLDTSSYHLRPSSPAIGSVPKLSIVTTDFYGLPVSVFPNGMVNAGVLFANSTSAPTFAPTRAPVYPTFSPTRVPTNAPIIPASPTRTPTKASTATPTKSPTRYPTMSPTLAPSMERVKFQTGLDVNGKTYATGEEMEISTQYIDSWNYNNGISYFGNAQYALSEGNTSYRVLMKFNNLVNFLPNWHMLQQTVIESSLTLTFQNYDKLMQIQGCVPTKQWKPFEQVRYKSTGWKFNQWNTRSATTESWTSPGGWADCDPTSYFSFELPATGTVTKTFPIGAAIVNNWIQSSNSSNMGLLLKSTSTGLINIMSSKYSEVSKRPALQVLLQSLLTKSPTPMPTEAPSVVPSSTPTATSVTSMPTLAPSRAPTRMPSLYKPIKPNKKTAQPTKKPTRQPTKPDKPNKPNKPNKPDKPNKPSKNI